MSVHAAHGPAKERTTLEARVLFAICFVPSLVHCTAMRCVRGRVSDQSILHEARAAAYTCVSFAFMG